MKINSVSFNAYDANVENMPPRILDHEVPMIYMFPAFHKNPPYLKFKGQTKVSEMGEWM